MKDLVKAVGLLLVVATVISTGFPGLAAAGKEGHRGGKGSPASTPAKAVPHEPASQAAQPPEAPAAATAPAPNARMLAGEQCGACHVFYAPELLPAGSWRRILSAPDDHFGESLSIPAETAQEIAIYLEANAADRSSSKRAGKIMSSLGGATPLRVTEVPYILKKHHKISTDVLRRPSIQSLANCVACHRTAANGVYDDDSVAIPK